MLLNSTVKQQSVSFSTFSFSLANSINGYVAKVYALSLPIAVLSGSHSNDDFNPEKRYSLGNIPYPQATPPLPRALTSTKRSFFTLPNITREYFDAVGFLLSKFGLFFLFVCHLHVIHCLSFNYLPDLILQSEKTKEISGCSPVMSNSIIFIGSTPLIGNREFGESDLHVSLGTYRNFRKWSFITTTNRVVMAQVGYLTEFFNTHYLVVKLRSIQKS